MDKKTSKYEDNVRKYKALVGSQSTGHGFDPLRLH